MEAPPSAFSTLLYDVDADGVATVTLNQPQQLNAINARLLAELAAAFRQARADELGVASVHLSLSHDAGIASAVVVLES